MKRWLIVIIVVLVAFGGLMLTVGIALKSTIVGMGKDRIIASLSSKTGVSINVSTVDLDMAQWFHFRPAVALGDVTIGNPPGFSAKNMVHAKAISSRFALLPLFHRQIEVQSIVIDQPEILVETNRSGATNVETFIKKLSSPSAGAPPGGASTPTSVEVNQFAVTSGTLTYAAGENISLHDINLTVEGFSAATPCHIELSAKYNTGSVSGFKIAGQAGPFTPDSLPLDAALRLTIAPSEIPAAVRREQFGVMLSNPGNNARANLDATMKGDAYRTFSGPAKVALSKIMVGGHQDHLVALSGEAPSNFSATGLMGTPHFELDIPNARLQLGKGTWAGSGNFRLQGKTLSGATRGAIRDIDINEFLSAFTSGGGKVYGLLAMPSSSLQFSGRNAAEMLNTLKGVAKISVTQGRITALDMPATLERVFGNAQPADAAKGNTAFSTMSADVNIAAQRMNVSDLVLESPVLRLTGNGSIGFDDSVDFALVAHVSGGHLGQLVSTGPFHMPDINAAIPLTVTGTIDAPKVRPQVGKIAKAAVQNAVENTVHGILGQFLKKKQ